MISPPPPSYCITFDDVVSASRRIDGLARRTPVMTCTSLDVLCSGTHADSSREGHNVDASRPRRSMFFKVEALQRTGSFKFRGALNAVLSLREELLPDSECEGDGEESGEGERREDVGQINVVTHSSGNHAAALALAARIASSASDSPSSDDGRANRPTVHATIVMPRYAPLIKRHGVIGFGGEIISVDPTNEARREMADRVVAERGAQFVHPSEDPRVIAGQGTAGLEFVEQVRQILRERAEHDDGAAAGANGRTGDHLDAVIIPVGGGGLASGNAIALRGLLGDDVKIILAEPDALDDAKRSREAGRLLGHAEGSALNSVADGLKTTLGPNTWPIVRDLVDDIITVSEEDILRATKAVWERLKVCIEPSAGVGVAVAMGREFAERYRVEDGIVNVGVILCGGNVDVIKIAKLMEDMGI